MDDLTMEHPDLEEYFDLDDGAMPEPVRQHLTRCRSCSAELAALVELRRLARTLPLELEPARDLWGGVAERMAGGVEQDAAVRAISGGRSASRWQRSVWPWLAAAAVVLMVVTSGATAYLLRDGQSAAAPTAGAPNPVGLAAFAAAETEYRYTVESLEAELAARRDVLSPATIQAVEQNLAIIDTAIAEARRALAADPTSADLPLLLSGVYRQKVELLRQAVNLTARS